MLREYVGAETIRLAVLGLLVVALGSAVALVLAPFVVSMLWAGGAELVGLGFVNQIGLQPRWSMRRQLSIQEYLAHPIVGSACGEAGYKQGVST